jgi:FKBP-type peptidyl-prolyl cis-trans isomerase FklB
METFLRAPAPGLIELQNGCNFEPNSDNNRLKIEIMKKTALIVSLCLSAVAPLLADGTNVLADDKSRLSYAIGMMFADRWKEQGVDVDPDLVLRGLKDGQSGGPTLMSQQDMQSLITTFQQGLASRQQQMREELIARNKAEGEAFLARNRTQPGVVTLPDGLQYKVITEGDGEVPGDNNTVLVNFRGTFVDGKEWDSTAQTGKPLELPVGRVFRGWSEALKLMKTGSKWQLFIPSELAYGQNGMSPRIPPSATLIMEVELLSVERPQPPPPAPTPPPSASAPLTSDIIKVPSAEEMKNGAKIEIIKPEDVQKLQQSQTNAAN